MASFSSSLRRRITLGKEPIRPGSPTFSMRTSSRENTDVFIPSASLGVRFCGNDKLDVEKERNRLVELQKEAEKQAKALKDEQAALLKDFYFLYPGDHLIKRGELGTAYQNYSKLFTSVSEAYESSTKQRKRVAGVTGRVTGIVSGLITAPIAPISTGLAGAIFAPLAIAGFAGGAMIVKKAAEFGNVAGALTGAGIYNLFKGDPEAIRQFKEEIIEKPFKQLQEQKDWMEKHDNAREQIRAVLAAGKGIEALSKPEYAEAIRTIATARHSVRVLEVQKENLDLVQELIKLPGGLKLLEDRGKDTFPMGHQVSAEVQRLATLLLNQQQPFLERSMALQRIGPLEYSSSEALGYSQTRSAYQHLMLDLSSYEQQLLGIKRVQEQHKLQALALKEMSRLPALRPVEPSQYQEYILRGLTSGTPEFQIAAMDAIENNDKDHLQKLLTPAMVRELGILAESEDASVKQAAEKTLTLLENYGLYRRIEPARVAKEMADTFVGIPDLEDNVKHMVSQYKANRPHATGPGLVINLTGSTGSGKTFFAERLAQSLFQNNQSFIPINMQAVIKDAEDIPNDSSAIVTALKRHLSSYKNLQDSVVLFDEFHQLAGLDPARLQATLEYLKPLLEGRAPVGYEPIEWKNTIVAFASNDIVVADGSRVSILAARRDNPFWRNDITVSTMKRLRDATRNSSVNFEAEFSEQDISRIVERFRTQKLYTGVQTNLPQNDIALLDKMTISRAAQTRLTAMLNQYLNENNHTLGRDLVQHLAELVINARLSAKLPSEQPYQVHINPQDGTLLARPLPKQ